MISLPKTENLYLDDEKHVIVLLDQSLLPNRLEYLTIDTPESMYEAILKLQVRGAPAIGIFAGYCMYVMARQLSKDPETFHENIHRFGQYLDSSRPTAVNLHYAIDRMLNIVDMRCFMQPCELIPYLRNEAVAIHEEDIASCKAIAEFGLSLLNPGDGIITHCNAGPLATSSYGTALGPLILAEERGIGIRVFADETRPLLQGARLTAWELQRAGVDVTLICDNMASLVMKKGLINCCFVGCDRVAMNGDAANKIGTSGLAILAKHYNIPFYVLGPTSTIDPNCPTGDDIMIEERNGEEIRSLWYKSPMAPSGVKCFNPAFDVTDHSLIAGIVTEKGIIRAPYSENIAAILK